MRTALAATFAVLAVLAAIVLVRTGGVRPLPEPERAPSEWRIDESGALARFSEALRFRTLSHAEDSGKSLDPEAFLGFHAFLVRSYPRAHAVLERETVSDYTLLYTWPGRDPALDPAILMGHIDVVPADPAAGGRWTHPPFEGVAADGFVWGRGTLDDKTGVIGLMEALEILAAAGFAPDRTLLLSFGHDEELGGDGGAVEVARLLEQRGVRPALVVDEGGAVISGGFPGIDFAVAAVGIAEKGYVSLDLVVDAPGGHSSAPPTHTAVGILAAAVTRLEASQMPSRLEGASRALFEALGPHAPFGYRLLFGNLWLFGGVLEQALVRIQTTAPLVRTTTAATMFEAGVKDNVLPSTARAVVNFRIYPGESIADVVAHARRVVDDDRIAITPREKRREPSALSPTDSSGFALLAETIRQIFPDAVVVPNLIPGGTDARHLRGIATNVYGFMPVRAPIDDVRRAHGNDERIAVASYLDAIRFYAQLMANAGSWR